MKKVKISKYLTPFFATQKDNGYWFGYYNYDPIDREETKLLANRINNSITSIIKGDTIEIGYYDLDSKRWHKIGSSDSFNWPQGCMLQWLPNSKSKVIFNTSEKGHNISIIKDIINGEERALNWSIYGLTPDGKFSVALDMERQHWCRGYHYESVQIKDKDVPVLKGDGVFLIDLHRNERQLLIDINDVINFDPDENFKYAKHWIEHIMISPNGKRFCFLHRYSLTHDLRYITRLFVCNIDGSNLQLIADWRHIDRTHFGWNGDEAFAVYSYIRPNSLSNKKANPEQVGNNSKWFSLGDVIISKFKKIMREAVPPKIKKELKILIKGQQSFYDYFEFRNEKFVHTQRFKFRKFDIDGHPSFTSDGKYMITDSYPDLNQRQRLLVLNIETKKAIYLAHIYAPLHGKVNSCDLHPKLSYSNQYLSVVSAYDGIHNIMVYKLNWNLIKKAID